MHGDFNLANTIATPGRLWVVDVEALGPRPRAYDRAEAGPLRARMIGVVDALRRDIDDGGSRDCQAAVEELSEPLLEVESTDVPANYIVRRHAEQAGPRKAVLRIYQIQREDFFPAAHTMSYSFVVLILILLAFAKIGIEAETLVIAAFLTFFVYLLRLLDVINKPFEVGHKHSAGDVSLFILYEFVAHARLAEADLGGEQVVEIAERIEEQEAVVPEASQAGGSGQLAGDEGPPSKLEEVIETAAASVQGKEPDNPEPGLIPNRACARLTGPARPALIQLNHGTCSAWGRTGLSPPPGHITGTCSPRERDRITGPKVPPARPRLRGSAARRAAARLIGAGLVGWVAVGCGGQASLSPAKSSHAAPASSPAGPPTAPHAAASGAVIKILVIMEENHSAGEVFPTGMPYLWHLARRYGYASDYRAITHPSLPNYLAIFTGSTFNNPPDCSPGPGCTYPAPSVFGQALARGKTARAYQESMPIPCDQSDSGNYAVRHNPWAYIPAEAATCRADDVPAGTPSDGALASDVRAGTLPNVGLITPNLIDDAHNGTLGQADAFLRQWIPVITSGPDWRDRRLAIAVVFDEGDNSNRVPCVLIAPGLSSTVLQQPLDHFALTRLIDAIVGAPPLRQAASAPNLAQQLGLNVG